MRPRRRDGCLSLVSSGDSRAATLVEMLVSCLLRRLVSGDSGRDVGVAGGSDVLFCSFGVFGRVMSRCCIWRMVSYVRHDLVPGLSWPVCTGDLLFGSFRVSGALPHPGGRVVRRLEVARSGISFSSFRFFRRVMAFRPAVFMVFSELCRVALASGGRWSRRCGGMSIAIGARVRGGGAKSKRRSALAVFTRAGSGIRGGGGRGRPGRCRAGWRRRGLQQRRRRCRCW